LFKLGTVSRLKERMSENTNNSLFAKTVVGIMAALIVIGIAASIRQNIVISSQLATLDLRIQTLSERITDLTTTVDKGVDDLEDTKDLIRANQLLLGTHASNHDVLRGRVTDVEKRVDVLETNGRNK